MTRRRILGPAEFFGGDLLTDPLMWRPEWRFRGAVPMDSGQLNITSGFLEHEAFRFNKHGGIDIGAPMSTSVRVMGPGVVNQVVNDSPNGCGVFVEVTHAFGYKTKYCHMITHSPSGVGIVEGMRVERGQQIGNIGVTGNSSGPHLHLQFKDPTSRPESDATWTTDHVGLYVGDGADIDEFRLAEFGNYVQVEAGDTLAGIVARENDNEGDPDLYTVTEVAEYNGIANINRINVGAYILFNEWETDEVVDDPIEGGTVNDGYSEAARDFLTANGFDTDRVGVFGLTGVVPGVDSPVVTPPVRVPPVVVAPVRPPLVIPVADPIDWPEVDDVVLRFSRGSLNSPRSRVGDIDKMKFAMSIATRIDVLNADSFSDADDIEVEFNERGSPVMMSRLKADSRGLVKLGSFTPSSNGLCTVTLRSKRVDSLGNTVYNEDVYQFTYIVRDTRDADFNLLGVLDPKTVDAAVINYTS